MSDLRPTDTFPSDRTVLHRTARDKLNEMAGVCAQVQDIMPDIVRVLKELGLTDNLPKSATDTFIARVTGRETPMFTWPSLYRFDEMVYSQNEGKFVVKANGRNDLNWIPLRNIVEEIEGFGVTRGPRGFPLSDGGSTITVQHLDYGNNDLVVVHVGIDDQGFEYPYCSVDNAYTVECAP